MYNIMINDSKISNISYNVPNKITIIINNENYSIENSSIIIYLLPFLKQTSSSNNPNIFLFPNTISKESLENFIFTLTILQSNSFPSNTNLNDFKRIKHSLNISLYLNAFPIIKNILENLVINNINITNCFELLTYLKDLLQHINVSNQEESFIDVIYNTINTCKLRIGQSLLYIIDNKEEELLQLNEEIIDEIVSIYFKYYDKKDNNEHKKIFKFIMKLKNIKNSNIFELLECERSRNVLLFQRYINEKHNTNTHIIKNTLFPSEIHTLTLNVEDITKGFTKESEISIGKHNFTLISRYSYEKDELIIKMHLNTNKDKSSLTHSYLSSESNILSEDEGRCSERTNCFSNLTSNQNSKSILDHKMISILSHCSIFDIKYESNINFNCLYSNLQQIITLFKIPNFYKQLLFYPNETNEKFNNDKLIELNTISNQNTFSIDTKITFMFLRSYSFSQLLTHVSKNFNSYISIIHPKSIQVLPKTVFNIILNYPLFESPPSENLLEIILIWLHVKEKIININNCLDLFKNIKWNELSIEHIVDFLMFNCAYVKNIKGLHSIIFNEILERLNSITSTDLSINENRNNNVLFSFINRVIHNSLSLNNFNNNAIVNQNHKIQCNNDSKPKTNLLFRSVHQNYLHNANYLNHFYHKNTHLHECNHSNNFNEYCYNRFVNKNNSTSKETSTKSQKNIKMKTNIENKNKQFYLNCYHSHKYKTKSNDKSTRNISLFKEEYSLYSIEHNNHKTKMPIKVKKTKHHKCMSMSNLNNKKNIKGISYVSISMSNALGKGNKKKKKLTNNMKNNNSLLSTSIGGYNYNTISCYNKVNMYIQNGQKKRNENCLLSNRMNNDKGRCHSSITNKRKVDAY